MQNLIDKSAKLYRKILTGMIVFFFASAVAIVFFQVLNRTFFKLTISWPEELARYLLIWTTFCAAIAALRSGSMAAIDMISSRFRGKAKLVLEVFQCCAGIAFMAVVMVNSLKVIALQAATGQTSPALQINMAVPYFAVPLWGALSILELIISFRQKVSGAAGAEAGQGQ